MLILELAAVQTRLQEADQVDTVVAEDTVEIGSLEIAESLDFLVPIQELIAMPVVIQECQEGI